MFLTCHQGDVNATSRYSYGLLHYLKMWRSNIDPTFIILSDSYEYKLKLFSIEIVLR